MSDEELKRYTPEGRFLRMEMGIEDIRRDVTDLKVAVARLEEQNKAENKSDAKRVSDRSYWWMRLGVGAAITIPIVLSILRIVFGETIP